MCNFKHGLSRHPLYNVWIKMKDRCFNVNCQNYKYYGGRGISVCEEWRNDFKVFFDFMIGIGWEQGLEIDRINNDGNYEPENVQVVTHIKNSQNKRNNVVDEEIVLAIFDLHYLDDLSHREIAKIFSINPVIVSDVINRNTWQNVELPDYIGDIIELRKVKREEMVFLIFSMYHFENKNQKEIGKFFNMTNENVSDILRRKTYKDIKLPNHIIRAIDKKKKRKKNVRLTEKQVLRIFEYHDVNISVKELAKQFNVSKNTIYDILSRRSWGNLELPLHLKKKYEKDV